MDVLFLIFELPLFRNFIKMPIRQKKLTGIRVTQGSIGELKPTENNTDRYSVTIS